MISIISNQMREMDFFFGARVKEGGSTKQERNARGKYGAFGTVTMSADSTGSGGLGAHLRAAVAADPVGWILVFRMWTGIVLFRVILVRRTKMN